MPRRKVKAMAPQQTETVELPDTQPTRTDVGGWQFPDHWTDEEINDWLVTHPSGLDTVGVETITIADPPAEDSQVDGGENGDASNMDEPEEVSEREVISALKADGYYAAAIAVPPDQQDTVNSDNYDPRQFFLVHAEVWNEFVSAVHREAELGLENKELRKRVNALTRGMRKVNKHWSATKRELKAFKTRHKQLIASWQAHDRDQYDRHEEELKRKDIFATRLARRLRKARAGRDKRERQLNLSYETIRSQERIIEKQDEYISHLEKLIGGVPLSQDLNEL